MTQRPASIVLPVSSSEIEPATPAEQLAMFGRAGQLALPGSVAQLGLDGVAYAPRAAPSSPEPRSGEPCLGTPTPGFGWSTEGWEGEGEDRDLPDPSDYERRLRASLTPPAPARQLVLLDETWDLAGRQATMWPQLDARLALVPERQQKCQRTRFKAASDVSMLRSSSGRWVLSGVVSCGRNTCPCCGRRRARTTAGLLGACFEKHRVMHPEGDHWMLTLGVPHQLQDGVERTNAWLYDACARFWTSRAWRRFAERWGIESKVRVYDAVHGGRHGTHPHFHIALFPTAVSVSTASVLRAELRERERDVAKARAARRAALREQKGMATNAEREAERAASEEEALRLLELAGMVEAAELAGEMMPLRDAPQSARRSWLRELTGGLLPAWRSCLVSAGCPHVVNGHAIDLSPSEAAERYFVKWGLAEEIGLSVEKDRSHLRLLDVVCASLGAQSDVAADLYREFNEAMAGRAWVTGMADTRRRLGVTDDDAEAYIKRQRERRLREMEREGVEPPKVPELHLVVRAHLWRAFLSIGHAEVMSWLDATSERVGHDVAELQREFDDYLWRALTRSRTGDTS